MSVRKSKRKADDLTQNNHNQGYPEHNKILNKTYSTIEADFLMDDSFLFFFENTVAFNIILGMDGLIKKVNRNVQKTLGYSEEEIIGQSALSFVSKSDRKQASVQLSRALRGEPRPELDVEIVHKNGQQHTIRFSSGQLQIMNKDRPEGILITGTDVTAYGFWENELRKHNEWYHFILEAISDGVEIHDENGHFIYINQKFCTMLGYPQEKLNGRSVEGFLDWKSRRVFSSECQRIRSEKTTHFELQWIGKGGRRIHTKMSSYLRETPENEYSGCFSIVKDITEKTLLEKSDAVFMEKINNLLLHSQHLSNCRNYDEVYDVIINSLEDVAGFEMSSIAVLENQVLLIKTSTVSFPGSNEDVMQFLTVFAMKVFKEGKNLSSFEGIDPELLSIGPKIKGVLGFPISDNAIFLVLVSATKRIEETDKRTIVLYLKQASASIRIIKLQEHISGQAILDQMTQVYNRCYLTDLLNREIKRSQRHFRQMGILIVEIDRFKKINEQYGINTGDKVLAMAARILRLCVRESDSIVRYGSAKFLIIMPETGQMMDQASQRITSCFEHIQRQESEFSFDISVSAGWTYWDPDNPLSIEKLIASANEKLDSIKKSQK
ncbi:sensor domain-containing diguanylate cyclase [bacterium]|nr:sensor domain-containing diguanylate cyclase [candidate division CSSED10-310 bacterium]